MEPLGPAVRAAQVVVPCSELQPTLDFFIRRLGFRIDSIYPADAPSTAVISGHGGALRLEVAHGNASPPLLRLLIDPSCLPAGTAHKLTAPNGMSIELVDAHPPIEVPAGEQDFVITRLGGTDAWGDGRAGMQYRDLLPSRWGGRFVASHIRIPEGGPVPDYVHYHRVRFQMIFCKAGWVKVVYEGQGPPFVLHPGDCVLQPPEIRHRVLEASPGLEVIELGCPALHETFADHELSLPNAKKDPDRLYSGQSFVHHVAKSANWSPWRVSGFESCDTGIAAGTSGLAGVRVVRSSGRHSGKISHAGELLFFFILRGQLGVNRDATGSDLVGQNESCALPAGVSYEVAADPDLEMLAVSMPAESFEAEHS